MLQEVYRHTLPIAAADWYTWAASAGFQDALGQQLQQLGVAHATIPALLIIATHDESGFGLALLDAATHLVTAVVVAKGVQPGAAATTLLITLIEQASQQGETDKEAGRAPRR